MKFKYLVVLLILLWPFSVFADEMLGVTTTNMRLRTAATTNSDRVLTNSGTNVVIAGEVRIFDVVDSTDPKDECETKKWYKIKGKDVVDGNEYQGYVCAAYINITNTNPNEPVNPDPVEEKSRVVAYGTINNAYIYVDASTKSALRSNKTYERIAILGETTNKDTSGCKDMYKILYSNMESYACKNSFINVVEVDVMDTSKIPYDFNLELSKFPESYRTYLRNLHAKHPNWRFYAINTNLDFYDAVDKEKNSSYIDTSGNDQSYFDTLEGANYIWATNTWKFHEANRWVTASKEAVAYYLDPRNYLKRDDGRLIFVFEDSRAYKHQDSAVQQMAYHGGITGTFAAKGKTYSYKDTFIEAARFSSVSPLTLIARSRIETGKFTSNSVSGTYNFTYNGKTRSGYYNYYNIGAYGSTPVTNGLIYAYNAGWDNRYDAIVEGASFIATKYVYTGQETQYFQKFNVNPASMYSVYSHQYQTNIQAPNVEGGYVYYGYANSGNIDQPVVFHIPVYNNMPAETSPEPKTGNPNNWLKAISINEKAINNTNDSFNGDLYYSYNNNWDNVADAVYESNVIRYTVPWNTEEILIGATPVVNTTRVSNTGNIKLNEKENIIDLVSKAENNTTKTYRIIVTKQDRPQTDDTGNLVYPDINEVLGKVSVKYNDKYIRGLSIGTKYETFKDTITKLNNLVKVDIKANSNNKTGSFATGDIVSLDNGKDKVTFTYTLFGDLNGDAAIDLIDLVHVRNIILEESNLVGAYKEAGDVNHDGKIDLIDLVYVRNDIMGTAISQE